MGRRGKKLGSVRSNQTGRDTSFLGRNFRDFSRRARRACVSFRTMTVAEYINHIYLDENGLAWIDDTRVKVIEVAMDHLAHGWSAEEIHRQHPGVSLAQAHAALAFYYDHQPEFDLAIAESVDAAERLARGGPDSPGRRRLRALGLLH